MKISDLNTRVQFQAETRVKDEGLGYTSTWGTIYDVAANAVQKDGSEVERHGRRTTIAPVVITVRWSPERAITTALRVLWGARKLNILSVAEAKPWVRVVCQEVDGHA